MCFCIIFSAPPMGKGASHFSDAFFLFLRMKKSQGFVVCEGRIKKFGNQGEKTGWTYFEIPELTARMLYPGNKKSFRVKGFFDQVSVKQIALIPMGGGKFIIPLNATMRKALGGKGEGDILTTRLKVDTSEFEMDQDLLDCLADEPKALSAFEKMPPSHRKYYSKWIAEAKTATTKAKRIAMTIEALVENMNFGQMLRAQSARNKQ